MTETPAAAPLQTLSQVHRITFHHLLCIYRSNGTGQVGFLHRTVTYHHHFFQCFGIFFQDNLQGIHVSGYFNGPCQITDVTGFQRRAYGALQREVSVQIGNHTVCRTLYDDIGTDNGFALLIYTCPFTVATLCCTTATLANGYPLVAKRGPAHASDTDMMPKYFITFLINTKYLGLTKTPAPFSPIPAGVN